MDEDAALTGREEKTSVKKVSTLTLPLVISEKLQLTKAFVECEGESIDLSGDMGAVGRILVPGTAEGNHVSFGHPEAKIGAIMNDFIQLKPHYGTLDGFLFDLEDESDKLAKATPHQIDQNDGIEEQTNEKTKAKAGPAGKRGTTAGGEEMKHAMSVFCFVNPAYAMAVLVRC
ncbi:hypothetical protein CUMW_248180 [Citrus unshiu]|uniref:Uncharacterized protein n=1 Tax=Citrus unshiu TaxID=55188 RepID=A0A2H5QP43_CITUN|nr:hypothetical protein CUMW_248180 [Citrus unshiu]